MYICMFSNNHFISNFFVNVKMNSLMHIRQVIFLIMFCLSVMASAQNTYLRVKVRPVDAVTNYMITQARVSLLSH